MAQTCPHESLDPKVKIYEDFRSEQDPREQVSYTQNDFPGWLYDLSILLENDKDRYRAHDLGVPTLEPCPICGDRLVLPDHACSLNAKLFNEDDDASGESVTSHDALMMWPIHSQWEPSAATNQQDSGFTSRIQPPSDEHDVDQTTSGLAAVPHSQSAFLLGRQNSMINLARVMNGGSVASTNRGPRSRLACSSCRILHRKCSGGKDRRVPCEVERFSACSFCRHRHRKCSARKNGRVPCERCDSNRRSCDSVGERRTRATWKQMSSPLRTRSTNFAYEHENRS